MMVGFSVDEAHRAKRRAKQSSPLWKSESCPLIEKGLTVNDCKHIIQSYGFPMPIKSSCFFCQFQTPFEWQWLKYTHPDLFQKALDLEANYYTGSSKRSREFGLFRGTPLWRLAAGQQLTMGLTLERSCWSGACGH